MKIKRLVIENFKSIERIELIEPNPFTVFVGPNGSGKSNIFEALEFVNVTSRFSNKFSNDSLDLFGGAAKITRRQNQTAKFAFQIESDDLITYQNGSVKFSKPAGVIGIAPQFLGNFFRLFIGKNKLVKISYSANQRLALDATNLEPVLKRILANDVFRAEIFEWLELFVPEFKAVEIDDRNELHWFEEFTPNYFTKDLISDGTYNILAMLTAVYQSDDNPQFLCIEEPENGLHPQVARELVDFFRIMCEERGHFIWLNTHSQSMISRVRPEEFVVVEKKQGATIARQFKKEDFHGMRADEAWLTNALNGGLAW